MENNLDLKAIRPGKSKYSPNLYKWLMHRNHKRRSTQSMVYSGHGHLWIGSVDEDGWFYGARLMAVLCNGSKEPGGAYADTESFTRLDDFWEQYIADGRCAIDREHEVRFLNEDDRWEVSEDGQTRTCLWCGKVTQYLDTWEETITRSRWTNVDTDSREEVK